MLINGVSAILLISPQAEKLADFYRTTLELPMEEEIHEGVPLHFACDLGDVHLAIHPADGWPGTTTLDARSPVIALNTTDATKVANKLSASGIAHTGVRDHGFALVVSFRDPDGNHVEVLEPR